MKTKEKTIRRLARYFDRHFDRSSQTDNTEDMLRTYYSIVEGFNPSFTTEQKDRIMTRFFKDWFSKDWYESASRRVPPLGSIDLTKIVKPGDDILEGRIKDYHEETMNLLERYLIELAEEEKGIKDFYISKVTPRDFEAMKTLQGIYPYRSSEYDITNKIMNMFFDRGILTKDEITSNIRRGQKRFLDDFLLKLQEKGLIAKVRM